MHFCFRIDCLDCNQQPRSSFAMKQQYNYPPGILFGDNLLLTSKDLAQLLEAYNEIGSPADLTFVRFVVIIRLCTAAANVNGISMVFD